MKYGSETLGWRFGYHLFSFFSFRLCWYKEKRTRGQQHVGLFFVASLQTIPLPHPTQINLHYQPEGSPSSQTPQASPTPTRGLPCQTRALVSEPLFLKKKKRSYVPPPPDPARKKRIGKRKEVAIPAFFFTALLLYGPPPPSPFCLSALRPPAPEPLLHVLHRRAQPQLLVERPAQFLILILEGF